MTTRSGLVQEYINTVPQKRMVTDRILNMEPLDIVAYSYLGTNMAKFNFANKDEYTYEWLNDTYTDRTDTLGASIADTTTTTCSVTTAANWQVGDVFLCGTEQIWISALSTTTATITRGYGSTTAATHDSGAVITRISRARIPGDDADDSPSTEVTSTSNYTQIFQRTINVARSVQKINKYGLPSIEDYLIDKAMDELMMDLARLPYYGRSYSGTSSAARYAGGFNTFITTNLTYATSTAATGGTAQALTRDHIDDTFQNIFSYGGDPNLILTVAHAQRKINDMYEGYVSTDRSEQLGGVLIKKLQNPITGKIVDVVVDRNCPSGELWIIDTAKTAFYPFDPFFYKRLGQTGDADKGEVVGEYGFVCANEKWHGAVKEFSATA
jgi:hypothetical protein